MKVAKILAITGGVLLAIFLVVELLLRFAFPVDMEPVTRILLSNRAEGFADTSVVYEIDGQGLRGYQWGKERKEGAVRILVAGGASTNHLMQNAENTWWGRLAKLLEEQTGRRIEIATIANVKGDTIVEGAAAARRVVHEAAPDIILAHYGFGDVAGHPLDYTYDPGKLDRLSAEDGKKRTFKYKLAEASHIARRIRRGRVAKARRAGQAQFERPNVYVEMLFGSRQAYRQAPFLTKLERREDPIQEYLQGVKAFGKLASDKGAKLVVIGEPTLHHEFLRPPELGYLVHTVQVGPAPENKARVSPSWIQNEIDRFYMEGWKACKDTGATFISLNAKIPRYKEYFLTETLLTDKGAQLVAEKLVPVVKPLVP